MLFLEILCDSSKTLFDISVNTGQMCMKFEADTPQKILKNAHLTIFPDKKADLKVIDEQTHFAPGMGSFRKPSRGPNNYMF